VAVEKVAILKKRQGYWTKPRREKRSQEGRDKSVQKKREKNKVIKKKMRFLVYPFSPSTAGSPL